MKFIETVLKGCFLIEPTVFADERGYFFESYHKQRFTEATGKEVDFVQDNQSKSKFGVVRGLHIQKGEFAQAKLVRVLQGKILDVAVDVRKGSATYGQSVTMELSGENNKQLFIPEGFLHGFSVLSEEAVVSYKCNRFYDRQSEDGVHPLDPRLGIDWKVPSNEMILSEKDSNAQDFAQFQAN